MVESTIQPQIIEIDTIKNGVCEILAHWDIVQIEREGQTLYQYEECRMKWILYEPFTTREEVQAYLDTQQDLILRCAKGAKVTLK